MFNTACYYLNFISPHIPAAIRRFVWTYFTTSKWQYNQPTAGYTGGFNKRGLGTVAFIRADGQITFIW